MTAVADREAIQVLVTGASGWIGHALCQHLTRTGYRVRGSGRRQVPEAIVPLGVCDVGDIGPESDWRAALVGSRVVVHLAGRAHVTDGHAERERALHHRINSEATLNLARQAAAEGVRRFVFISTLKVHGDVTPLGQPARPDDPVDPQDAYGRAKWTAELGLRQIGQQAGMEVVVIRPPLVYGPGVRANFGALMQAVARGWPMPLGAVTGNRRSFVALDNLVSLMECCIQHPAAAGQTLLVSDGEDLSTAELLRRMGRAMNRPARLWPVPVRLLTIGAAIAGRTDMANRLLGCLQADISKTRSLLGWAPPRRLNDALRDTAISFGIVNS